jgi:acetylglutamate kinase
VEKAILKAGALIEALGYIQRFHDKIVVIKMGGSLMDDEKAMDCVLTDIVFLSTVGMRPIIVHGGGKEITEALKQAGLETRFVQGRRYTDQRTLSIAEHVLCHTVNRRLVKSLNDRGAQAMEIHSLASCVLFGERMFLDGEEGRRIDIGFVGKVTRVNDYLLKVLCQSETIPVIAPIAVEKAGGKLNINADEAAGEVAAAVQAEKLVVLSDTHGIRMDPSDPTSLVSELNEGQIEELVKKGVITGGMMPKVDSCLRALKGGVKKAHIIDGRIEHSLLLEIYTDKGIGTQIVR